MCGIVGYVGPQNAVDILVAGLTHLEYRGYDSVGISTFINNEIKTNKTQGRIKNILPLIQPVKEQKPRCGIGHTRWATHGEPSDINSHPHGSPILSLVHNGIIENYQSIKERMIRKGYEFESQTDTEVVAKLLDYYMKEKKEPKKAIQKVIEKLRGSYAIGIIFKEFPQRIFAIRSGSPLIIGLGDDENFIASDMTALLSYTKRYYLLEENELAIIDDHTVEVIDMDLLIPIVKEVQIATWDAQSAEKGGYDHFMIKEINQQPDVFKQTISPRIVDGHVSFAIDNVPDDFFETINRIHIVACGTAMHAGLVAKQWIERKSGIYADVDVASEFRYRKPLLHDDDLVIIISQSGETADSLACLRLAKAAGIKTLAIVNVFGSSIAREADHTMMTYAGIEISVASTKAYYTQLGLLYLIASKLGTIHQGIVPDLKQLHTIEAKAAMLLSNYDRVTEVAARFQNIRSAFFIGRGLDYTSASEGSLKLKEISYVHSEAYPAGELKHGTISLMTNEVLVIALATQSDTLEKTLSNIQEVKARQANIMIITKENYDIDQSMYDYRINIPECDDEVAPLLSIIPLQLFAYTMSVLRGCDVDKPRNLAKSVTVE